MLSWLFAFAVAGVLPQLAPDGALVAPVDIHQGQQLVELRGPVVARTPGTRLVLFVRELNDLTAASTDRNAAFERAVPPGSVRAKLRGDSGELLEMTHTGYTYYRGFAGLVLTENQAGARRKRYSQLEVDADIALPNVRFVWLDQRTRTVRDVPPPR